MAITTDIHFNKLLELKHRIEFLRNDVDPDILIGAIERELSQLFEFQCNFNLSVYHKKGWKYYIRFPSIQHSENFRSLHNETKLDALYEALEDLTRK